MGDGAAKVNRSVPSGRVLRCARGHDAASSRDAVPPRSPTATMRRDPRIRALGLLVIGLALLLWIMATN
jgi:hypothetical protein